MQRDSQYIEETESEFIYKAQIGMYDASYHVQRECYEKFQQLAEEGKAVVLTDDAEHEQLGRDLEKDQLKYSNDMVVDMIIDKVYNHVKEEELKKVIDRMKIGNLPIEVPGRSFEKYFDDSFFTSLGRPFLLIVRQASDIMACFFLNDFKFLEPPYSLFFLRFISILAKSIGERQDEQYKREYGVLQFNMKYMDDHIYHGFTDLLIFYSREMEEMAVAFLIGHELGHHVLGHTTKENSVKQSCNIEYAADKFGFVSFFHKFPLFSRLYIMPNLKICILFPCFCPHGQVTRESFSYSVFVPNSFPQPYPRVLRNPA